MVCIYGKIIMHTIVHIANRRICQAKLMRSQRPILWHRLMCAAAQQRLIMNQEYSKLLEITTEEHCHVAD